MKTAQPVCTKQFNFGASVAGLGDVNGDGVPDCAIGAYNPALWDTPAHETAVFIVFMSRTGQAVGEQRLDATNGGLSGFLSGLVGVPFGAAVTGMGDADLDGIPDLVLGFPDAPGSGGLRQGAVAVCLLQHDGTVRFASVLDLSAINGSTISPLERVGASISTIGDLNDDGVPDLLVGQPGDRGSDNLDEGGFFTVFLQ